MNWTQLEQRWNEFAGSAAAHWSKLSRMDIIDVAGKQDRLVQKVQLRYGLSPSVAELEVEEWRQSLQDLAPLAKSH